MTDKESQISPERIGEFVDMILAKKNVNIKYLPDSMEKQVYVNVFTILLGVLEEVVDSTSINFMGHKIKLSIEKE